MTALARARDRLPRAVALVVGDGDDDRVLRSKVPLGDQPLQRLAVGALEVAERLGADAADARVAVVGVRDSTLALVLDVGKLELLAEDGGELVERDVDLEDVIARLPPGLALAGLLPRPGRRRDRRACHRPARRRPAACRRSGSAGCRSGGWGSRPGPCPCARSARLARCISGDSAGSGRERSAEAAVVLIDLQRHGGERFTIPRPRPRNHARRPGL